MVKIFRDKSPINILFLVLLSLMVHFHFFFKATNVVTFNNDGIFSVLIKNYLPDSGHPFLVFVYFLVILLQSVRINQLLMELKLFHKSGYTVGMTYVILTGFIIEWGAVTPALFANSLLILIFFMSTKLFNQSNPKTLLFNIGLIVGVTVLCYHPSAIIILILMFTLGIMRSFRLQEWFILLIGIALPYYFIAGWLFLHDELYKITNFIPQTSFGIPNFKIDNIFIQSVAVLGLSFLSGLICWRQFSSRLLIQMRKNWNALLLMCLVLLAAPFVYKDFGIYSSIMCIVPLSAFISNGFSYPKRLVFPNLLFLLMMAVVVYNNWYMIKF